MTNTHTLAFYNTGYDFWQFIEFLEGCQDYDSRGHTTKLVLELSGVPVYILDFMIIDKVLVLETRICDKAIYEGKAPFPIEAKTIVDAKMESLKWDEKTLDSKNTIYAINCSLVSGIIDNYCRKSISSLN